MILELAVNYSAECKFTKFQNIIMLFIPILVLCEEMTIHFCFIY